MNDILTTLRKTNQSQKALDTLRKTNQSQKALDPEREVSVLFSLH